MIELNKSKVILFKNYTFSKRGRQSSRQYFCSRKTTLSCTAKMYFDQNMKLKHLDDVHNHPPPELYRTSDGKYVKIVGRATSFADDDLE